MSMSVGHSVGRRRFHWYTLFKYSIYALLANNVYQFFLEEWLAAAHTFTNGPSLAQLIDAYSATIDTAAWWVLLIMFELETWVIPDEKLKGRLKWLLNALKLVCYSLIVYALYGYLNKYLLLQTFEPALINNACSQAALGLSFMTDLNEYTQLTAANCATLPGDSPYFGLTSLNILTNADSLANAQYLATIDLVNASNWILILIILEVDVWLQLYGKLSERLMWLSGATKALLYLILLTCAALWGLSGSFLDFWDAFLWILAFAFIELNLFEWHAEKEHSPSTPPSHP